MYNRNLKILVAFNEKDAESLIRLDIKLCSVRLRGRAMLADGMRESEKKFERGETPS